MTYKKFIKLFFLIPFLLILFIFTTNYIVDPFNITNFNVLNIKYKMARDDRVEKIGVIKKIPQIDNLILGSSRTQNLNPIYMTEKFGGKSYNFGVGSATIEDSLGLLLYLKKNNKLPKNVLIALDFASFNKDFLLHESFFKLPELNFLEYKADSNNDFFAKMLSIDAIRATFKTLKYHIKKRKPNTYFNEDGYKVSNKIDKIDKNAIKEKIVETANKYYKTLYSNGKYKISEIRFKRFEQLVDLCKQNNINLIVSLSPVHIYQYNLIHKDKELYKTLVDFKMRLSKIISYRDFMINSQSINNDLNFRDSIHFKKGFAEIYMEDILNQNKSDLFILRKKKDKDNLISISFPDV